MVVCSWGNLSINCVHYKWLVTDRTRQPSQCSSRGSVQCQVTSFGIVSPLHLYYCAHCPPTFTQSSGSFCASCWGSPGAQCYWMLSVSPEDFSMPLQRGYCHIPQRIWKEAAACINVREVTCFQLLTGTECPMCVWWSVCASKQTHSWPIESISFLHCTVQNFKLGFTVWCPLLTDCFILNCDVCHLTINFSFNKRRPCEVFWVLCKRFVFCSHQTEVLEHGEENI